MATDGLIQISLLYYHLNTYVSPDNTEYCCQGAVVCIFVYFTFLCNSYVYTKNKTKKNNIYIKKIL